MRRTRARSSLRALTLRTETGPLARTRGGGQQPGRAGARSPAAQATRGQPRLLCCRARTSGGGGRPHPPWLPGSACLTDCLPCLASAHPQGPAIADVCLCHQRRAITICLPRLGEARARAPTKQRGGGGQGPVRLPRAEPERKSEPWVPQASTRGGILRDLCPQKLTWAGGEERIEGEEEDSGEEAAAEDGEPCCTRRTGSDLVAAKLCWTRNGKASHAYCSPAGAAGELEIPHQQLARLPPIRRRTVGRRRRRSPSTKQRSSAAALEGLHQKLSEA